jgi:hypothetical protein
MHKVYIQGWRSHLPEIENVEFMFTSHPESAERWYTRTAAELFVKTLRDGITFSLNGSEITCTDFGIEEASPGVFVIYFDSSANPSE